MKTLFLIALLELGFVALAPEARAQGGIPLWTNRYNGPGNSDDNAYRLAVDGSGDVIVTGSSYDAGSGNDYATIKYSSAGVPLWTNRYNGPGNDSDQAGPVAVDTTGNVFVTGYSYGTGSGDYATIKYSGAGVPLWTNRYDGPGNSYDSAYAVAVDSSGNVFVTGPSSGVGSSHDYATIKYSGAGVPLWTNRYNGPGNGFDTALAIAVDGSGNVFVTGFSYGNGIGNDYATIKYSSVGVPLWTNRYTGPGNGDHEAHAVAVDGSGNVFVTGNSVGIGSGHDYATIKYSSSGVPLWTNRYNGPGSGSDYAFAVALDGSGNVFVTGSSFGVASGFDYATIKYSSAGVPLWTARYNGPGNGTDAPSAIAVDRSGNVFVTGYSSGTGSGDDYATIAYSNGGIPLWTNRYNGPANAGDSAGRVAVDSNGNGFVTGYSAGSGSGNDYATIKYSSSIVPLDALTIFSQPQSQAVRLGSNVTFSVSAGSPAPPISYEWRFNGTKLDGETNATLLLTNVQASQRGDYTVLVSDTVESLLSAPGTLSLLPFVFTAQPTNQNVLPGTNVTLTVAALGNGPIRYQWQFEGTNLLNATNASYSFTNASLAHHGTYAVIATDDLSTNLSASAFIYVLVKPVFAVNPVAQTVLQGGTARFTAIATGAPPIWYRWLRTGAPILTNDTGILVLTNVQASATIRVVATNPAAPTGVNMTPSSGVPLTMLPDFDHDGMSDWWETNYPGFSTNNSADALLDFDGDGLINRDEYLAGTSPIDPLSTLRLFLTGTNFDVLQFVAQSNITYTVQCRTNLSTASWGDVTNVPAQSFVSTAQVNAAVFPAGPEKYYRIVIRPRP